jgi:hypothetical protein
VASIAAGNIVHNTSFYGLASGVARGGAPRAQIAVYKACWSVGAPPADATCSEAAVMKAIDDAIHDGVDILSMSILSVLGHILAFHAVAKGIPVVYAAGNFGPYAQMVGNVAPWLFTVAASTIDRLFPTAITLGNGQTLTVCFYLLSIFIGTRRRICQKNYGKCDINNCHGSCRFILCYPRLTRKY